MGTRGLFALRYKGYYHIRYNHCDSYPRGLGQDLAGSIPASQTRFEQWLEKQRMRCETLASSNLRGNDFEISKSPPRNDLHTEWTYTYDLDNLLFVVDSRACFSLQGIASRTALNWVQFISTDARGNRCLALDTPTELIGQFACVTEPFLGGDPTPAVEAFVPTSTISPSTWSKPLTLHHRRLMLAQVNTTIAETYSKLSIYPSYQPSEGGAQDFAMSFLEAIVPNNQAIVLNRRSPTLDTDGSKPAPPEERSPWFWYRGCLILVATQLDDNDRFQVYVQAVAARAKAKNLDRCTALVWSIRHVAVVEISGGVVSHSDPIPLLAAYGLNEEGFLSALHLLWHYLPYPRWRIVDQQPTSTEAGGSNSRNLPTEIALKIMGLTDQLHYPKFQFLSRSFFELWWHHLRVGPYTILPDGEKVDDACRCFKAYSADENVLVRLRLKVLWGRKTGSSDVWRTDDESGRRDQLETVWWGLRCRQREEAGNASKEDFSRQGTNRYRLQRFYSYWPEDVETISEQGSLQVPRVDDQFSGQTDVLICEAEPI